MNVGTFHSFSHTLPRLIFLSVTLRVLSRFPPEKEDDGGDNDKDEDDGDGQADIEALSVSTGSVDLEYCLVAPLEGRVTVAILSAIFGALERFCSIINQFINSFRFIIP